MNVQRRAKKNQDPKNNEEDVYVRKYEGRQDQYEGRYKYSAFSEDEDADHGEERQDPIREDNVGAWKKRKHQHSALGLECDDSKMNRKAGGKKTKRQRESP